MTPRDEKRFVVLEVPEECGPDWALFTVRSGIAAHANNLPVGKPREQCADFACSARLISLDDALVERVARAMHLAAHSSSVDDWREHGNGVMQCYRLLSKAAISDLLGGEG